MAGFLTLGLRMSGLQALKQRRNLILVDRYCSGLAGSWARKDEKERCDSTLLQPVMYSRGSSESLPEGQMLGCRKGPGHLQEEDLFEGQKNLAIMQGQKNVSMNQSMQRSGVGGRMANRLQTAEAWLCNTLTLQRERGGDMEKYEAQIFTFNFIMKERQRAIAIIGYMRTSEDNF